MNSPYTYPDQLVVKGNGILSMINRGEVINGLARIFVENKWELRDLLHQNGAIGLDNATNGELVSAIISHIENHKFRRGLAALAVRKGTHKNLLSELSDESDYRGFDLMGLLGNSGGAGADSKVSSPEIVVGADPVSAIAGAIGSIFNVIGHSQQKKTEEERASSQLLMQIMALEAQKNSPKKVNNTPLIIGGVIIISTLGLLAIFLLKKSNN